MIQTSTPPASTLPDQPSETLKTDRSLHEEPSALTLKNILSYSRNLELMRADGKEVFVVLKS